MVVIPLLNTIHLSIYLGFFFCLSIQFFSLSSQRSCIPNYYIPKYVIVFVTMVNGILKIVVTFSNCYCWYIGKFFLRFYLFIFRERGREGEREEEKYPCVRNTSLGCLLHSPDLARNPGMCPDRESNQWISGCGTTHWVTPVRATGKFLMYKYWSSVPTLCWTRLLLLWVFQVANHIIVNNGNLASSIPIFKPLVCF